MIPFESRADAGRRLARALGRFKPRHPVILALPRGGVPVAAEIASALDAPLDLLLVRKIGVPSQPELAMGAVVDGASPIIVRNEDIIRAVEINLSAFDAACHKELAEIERRRETYLGDRARTDITGRVVIIVDDGIATGATIKAALQAVRQRNPKELVLAVPVAPPETVSELRPLIDDLVCLETPELFGAIGYFYRDFEQLEDSDVIAILNRFPAEKTSGRPPPESKI
jgi:predicted phosphoribosyltransferase